MYMASKVKLTINIDKNVLDAVKNKIKSKGSSISRIVENFLEFYVNPHVYCFKCGVNFPVDEAEICPKCGWLKCVSCNACRCELSDETAAAVFHMRRVYEDLLMGKVK